jgi:adenine specific DNA methylase Mod
MLLKELLTENGTIYVHIDSRRAYLLRAVLDEVFGSDNFENEIAWQRTPAHSDTKGRYGEIHDTILRFRKGDSTIWNQLFVPYSEEYLSDKYNLIEESTGRRYRLDNLTAPGPRPNLEYEWRGIKPPPGRRWAVEISEMERYDREGRIVQ